MEESVTIYGPAFSSYVRGTQLCCEEKGIDYTLHEEITPRDLATLKSPFQKVPILKHNDFVLF